MVKAEKTRIILDKAAINPTAQFVVAGIPAFNEEHSIAHMVIEAQKFADTVIVCDDGSSDLTAKIAGRLGAEVVRHEKNRGYGAAIRSLFKKAMDLGADILVTLDGDGQHDASEIPRLIQPIKQDKADIVIGSRFINETGSSEMPFYRKIGAQLITKMVNGSAKNGISDSQSGFRAYNRQAIERLCVSEVGMGASVQILLEASKNNLRIYEVPSTCKYENGNVSTSTKNPFTHGVSVVMSIIRIIVEERPLTFLGIPGLMCLFAGLGFGVWLMQIYAITHAIVTNIALAAITFVVIGFFMLSTAITLYAITRIAKK
jgi:glycosyltransferase involved in cell wall biosynthesis